MARPIPWPLLVLPAAFPLAAACAPIFGIDSRAQGDTWCEQPAQATTQGYCNDFDRTSTATTMQELSATLHGQTEVTDAAASSLPNSLAIETDIVEAGAGVLAGRLVSFGPAPGMAGLPPFQCQADLRPSEVGELMKAGATIGVLGVGGQATTAQGAPEIVVMSFVPGGRVSFAVNVLPSPTEPAREVSASPCVFSASPELTGDWLTFEISFGPASALAGGIPEGACPLDLPGGARADAGEYVLLVRVGPFDLTPIRIPDPGYAGQPYFVYGLFFQGPAEARTLHVDNVRCTTKASL